MSTPLCPSPRRLILLRYTLRNGHHGSLLFVAGSTGEALISLFDIFGTEIRRCSAAVRP
jgi:hypothetical protein